MLSGLIPLGVCCLANDTWIRLLAQAVFAGAATVVIYSDGLIEAPDAAGVEFGVQRLMEELPAISHLSAGEVCSRLWSKVQEYGGDQSQFDDFTVVVVKRAR